MARWLLPFTAIDPRSLSGHWKTGVSQAHYQRICRFGHEKQQARILLVEDVLEGSTLHLYQGWSRPDKEDCYVYVGKPARDFKSLNIETPPPPEMVFLVFVLPDGTIDDWAWRAASSDNRPDGVSGEPIWSANPS